MKEIHAIEKKLETDPEWMYLNTIDLNKMFETTRPIYVRPVSSKMSSINVGDRFAVFVTNIHIILLQTTADHSSLSLEQY